MNLQEYTFVRIKNEPNYFYSEDEDGQYALIYVFFDYIREEFYFIMVDSEGSRWVPTGTIAQVGTSYMAGWATRYTLFDDLLPEIPEVKKINKRTNLIDDFI